MTLFKKPLISPSGAYKAAAAARRLKLASMATPIADEIKPVQGRVRVKLSGKPIRQDAVTGKFERSTLDIPEYSTVRKRRKP